MRSHFSVLLIGTAGLAVVLGQTPTIKRVPLAQTSPTSGKEMFETYCAVCHGMDGRGVGPAATALKKSPADLTQLTRKSSDGKFPELRVTQVLTVGPAEILAHGSRDMPIWGQLFKSLGSSGEGVARIRIVNLTDYIRSMQAR
jgi:mono/diheme cytochrome c family protein